MPNRLWNAVARQTRAAMPQSMSMGDRPKGAGAAAAPPRKNNSACRNENRAIVSTAMRILSE